MRQKSDIGAFHTGASIEVDTGLIVFGTEDSLESATVSETVPDQSIELGGRVSIEAKLFLTNYEITNL